MSVGLVLVLDGPSSVGKSTTIAALQERWPVASAGPLVAPGLDAARDMLGRGGQGRWTELVERIEPSVAGRPPRFRYGPLGRELVAGMHRAASAWARRGFDVALDHCIIDTSMLADLRRACDDVPLMIVGMTCDPVVLDDRELGRTGVRPGRSAAQRASVVGVEHTETVDTTAATTDEVVAEVLAIVARTRRA